MISPYAVLAADFFNQLNEQFLQLFDLPEAYQYDGITETDRFGVITIRSLGSDRSRRAGSQVREGYQSLVMNLDILFTIGALTRIDAEAKSLETMLDLHHGIPALKLFLDSQIFYDLTTDENFTSVKRQALKPPHNWIADISCGATANLMVYVDSSGKHQIKNEL